MSILRMFFVDIHDAHNPINNFFSSPLSYKKIGMFSVSLDRGSRSTCISLSAGVNKDSDISDTKHGIEFR